MSSSRIHRSLTGVTASLKGGQREIHPFSPTLRCTRSTSTRSTTLAFELFTELCVDIYMHINVDKIQVHPRHNSDIQAFRRICYRQSAWTRQPIFAATLKWDFFCVDRQCGPDPCTSTRATTLAFKLFHRQPILATTLTVFSQEFCVDQVHVHPPHNSGIQAFFTEFCVDRQCGPDPRPPMPQLWHGNFCV